MRRLLVVLAAVVLIGSACGDDGSGTASSGGGASSDGSSYETITALNDDLAAAGITCELEYEGLTDADREISQCVINDEQASLNIWFNDGLRQAIIDAAPTTVAYGANWTVEVATPETARELADALNGNTGSATGATD